MSKSKKQLISLTYGRVSLPSKFTTRDLVKLRKFIDVVALDVFESPDELMKYSPCHDKCVDGMRDLRVVIC